MKYLVFVCILLFTVGCSNNSPSSSAPKSNVMQEKSVSPPQTIKNGNRPDYTSKTMLQVPIIAQNPELKYGCEITSLAMVLRYAGMKVDKMQLSRQLKKDTDPIIRNKDGNIIHWGNPAHGFVGDITGKNPGYAVYAKPLEDVMKQYLPGRTLNLTNKPFNQLLEQINRKRPVIVWTTGDFRAPDRWESWKHGNETIKTPLDLHAVVLVGFDKNYVYLNDPLSGRKAVRVNKQQFITSWVHLGKQALSYR